MRIKSEELGKKVDGNEDLFHAVVANAQSNLVEVHVLILLQVHLRSKEREPSLIVPLFDYLATPCMLPYTPC